jgi:prophage tail gpP-like protein
MITLKIAKAQIEGFQTYKMMSTMKALSDVFELTCPNSPSAQGLTAGSACEVLIDDDLTITGAVDRIHYSSKSRILTWTGRDKTGDMVDSTPVVSTGQWTGLTAKEIIASIALPFGITVTGEDGLTFPQYNTELDATCAEIIAELCSMSGMLATSSSDGNIVLTKAATIQSEIILQEGRNIKDMEFIADASAVFSSYKVIGQQSFTGTDQTSATQPFGTVAGTGASPRLMTVINSNSMDYASAASQAEWIAADKESSQEYVKVTIAEYSKVQPNTLITLVSDTLRISGQRLIETVIWEYSPEEGHHTTFILVNPSKYGGTLEEFSEWL